MSELIQTETIQGLVVYGQQQVSYTVAGHKGKDYCGAVMVATLQVSTALEVETTALSEVVRVRDRKLKDLGVALSILAQAETSLSNKNPSSNDKTGSDPKLETAQQIIDMYGIKDENGNVIDLHITDNNKTYRKYVLPARASVNYEIESEDNALQQNIIALQGLVSRRDTAFSTASKLVMKVNSDAQSLIKNFKV